MDGRNVDFSGFTKQTATILCGIGAKDLIREFRKKDLSTSALFKLTKEDFMQLGVSEDRAVHMANTLNISKKKDLNIKPKGYEKISDNIQILKVGKQQLAILQAFIAYCGFRFEDKICNYFMDHDKAISISQIQCAAVDFILKEINEAELKLTELKKPKPRLRSIFPYMLYCTSIGVMSIAMYKLMNKFWK